MKSNQNWPKISGVILLSVFVCLTVYPNECLGQRVPATVFMEQGDPAPFAGDLIHPDRSARIASRLSRCESQTVAESESLVGVARFTPRKPPWSRAAAMARTPDQAMYGV